MPEPDFDQIARQIVLEINCPDLDPDGSFFALCAHDVAGHLRRVWNARGEADTTAVSLKLIELQGTASAVIHGDHYRNAIAALDR